MNETERKLVEEIRGIQFAFDRSDGRHAAILDLANRVEAVFEGWHKRERNVLAGSQRAVRLAQEERDTYAEAMKGGQDAKP